MNTRGLRMAEIDSVATVLSDAVAGERVDVVDKKSGRVVDVLNALEDIPCYHKIALRDIALGSEVRKYGEVIGVATANILRGSYVHVHNIESKKTRNHD